MLHSSVDARESGSEIGLPKPAKSGGPGPMQQSTEAGRLENAGEAVR
jgi:hypothetical protein